MRLLIYFLLQCGMSDRVTRKRRRRVTPARSFIRVIYIIIISKFTHLCVQSIIFQVMQNEQQEPQSNQMQAEGRWDELEHEKFLQALMTFGKNWKMIEEVVQTRTTAQVRSHAQKFFLKLHKIQKERKKNLKKGISQPSKVDQELTKSLLQQTFSAETPTQILVFLRREAPQGTPRKKDQCGIKALNLNEKHKYGKSQIIEEMLQGNQEESFLISLIRQSKGFGDPEQALNDMIAFPEIHRQEKEEEETANKRKFSFSLYEEEEGEERYYGVPRRMKEE